MNLKNLLLTIVCTLSLSAQAQNGDTSFTKQWAEIDTLIIAKNLTKQALVKVNDLYVQAKQLQLPAQQVKALLYKLELEQQVTETEPNIYSRLLNKEIEEVKDMAAKSIIHSLQAKHYLTYFNQNRWKFYNRTATVNYVKDDMLTWGNNDFNAAITYHYLQSLQPEKLLQQTAIAAYDAVIVKGNTRQLRPTLFDLLAHEALDYFKSGEAYVTNPSYAFVISDVKALAPINEFAEASFSSIDTASHLLMALQLFQKLVKLHQFDIAALIDVDIERIQWVHSHLVADGKDQLKTAALSTIIKKYSSHPNTQQAWYLWAKDLADKAATYNAYVDTANRYTYVKAKQMALAGLTISDKEGEGHSNLLNLIDEIENKELSLEAEKVNIPAKPFRMLVHYRNIDTLFVTVIKKDKKHKFYDDASDYAYQENLSEVKIVKSFTQVLPLTKDYQRHSVEIKIDALPVGEYAVLVTSKQDLQHHDNELALQHVYVSNISYIRNGKDIFVLNRQTGMPFPGVKVTVMSKRYNNKTHKNDIIREAGKTNSAGLYHIVKEEEAARNNGYRFSFHMPKDSLQIEEDDYNYNRYNPNGDDDDDYEKDEGEDYEKEKAKVFFFTDRGIYRPGQTVYFKGIAITKDVKTRQSKLFIVKDSIKVFLGDMNGKAVDSLSFKMNEYGSFSGKFSIPQNVLTGYFSVSAKSFGYQSSASFSVEEYKRPTFYVEFDKVKTAYRLNDSVTVTGFAKSYAGANIDGAKIKFNVERSARFIYDWLWTERRPYSRNTQVSFGEITTGADGRFSIGFKATPDSLVNASTEPLFDFNITADITDGGGETRNSKTQVTVGYKSMVVNVNVPPIAEADSLKQLIVSTKNLNGEKEPAQVDVKIYKLQAPERLIRNRFWQRPDQFVMTRSEYLQSFPNDDYSDDNNYKNWQVIATSVSKSTNTVDGGKLQLPVLTSGFYKVEAIAKDKYGKEVKDVKYMQLFSRNSLPYPKYQFNYIVNNYVQPGQTAQFITGSFADKLFVVQQKIRPALNGKQRQTYQYINRTKGVQLVTYRADETDRGNVGLQEAFVFDNRIYTNSYNITIPWTNKELVVNYTTYRDKTEPGSDEKWTVNIKGSKGEKAAAELLTTMYDASLDAFVKHELAAPPIWQGVITYNNFSGRVSFFNQHSNTHSNSSIIYRQVEKEYDHFFAVAEFYKKAPMVAFDQALAGRVAGVNNSLGDNDIIGYSKAKGAPGASTKIIIRGNNSITNENKPLYIIDGVPADDNIETISPADIISIDILKDAAAIASYGSKAANGVIIITTKKGAKKSQQPVTVRRNFNETAFFFPQLYADSSGNYSFSFTMPDAVTQWKWMSLAHTKNLQFGAASTLVTTQKTLMVQSNAPRFVREGDNMEFSTKITNLSNKELTGQVQLELVDAVTNTSVDGWFQNMFPSQYFTVVAGQSTAVKFPIAIPFNYNKPLLWRVVARAGNYSDGEEKIIPVVTNRMLVTESLPLLVKGDTVQQFVFDKLLNNKSESLTNESLTVEYTANPIWNAVQALPYLMEYPYECAEQIFNRFYANALAAYITGKHLRIKAVFEQWVKDSSLNSKGLQNSASKVPTFGGDLGAALKQVLLQETPWVLQAENEEQQKKNIALLFDVIKMADGTNAAIEKLKQMQMDNGAFPWFKGGYEDRNITSYILTGIGKLKKMGALGKAENDKLNTIIQKALSYLDNEIVKDYNRLLNNKPDMKLQHISSFEIQYLYLHSFFTNQPLKNKEAYNYYYQQAKQYWVKQNLYHQSLLGAMFSRNGEIDFAVKNILPSITENAIINQQGMYWKDMYTSSWYQSPVEFESAMINLLNEINQQQKSTLLTQQINDIRTWLILNKQTNNWRTTVATADACYALLAGNDAMLNSEKQVKIELGSLIISSELSTAEAATGYFKKRIEGSKIKPAMGNVTVTTTSQSFPSNLPPLGELKGAVSYGSVYWQYFEDLDKITPSASPLAISKKLFIEMNSNSGKVLTPVNDNDEVKIGDKVVIRLILKSDRDMDYVHLKDMRASTMEPVNVLSTYKYQDGLGYYEATKDASTNFFFGNIRKGTYVFEYPVYITHSGTFSIGIANIQCMYAPEFTSHSEGMKIRVIGQ